eukprot:TRINITY_DN3518_c0_g1_i1.p1 TRINITY_DN3518_c0_g1~~TRINITY_DN3518_c0_g1_i1.p1  ORF type:complete len:257 (-),score=80.64 TRINITY_DN3518_c0_g1_i1:55-825(-)
MRWRWQQDEEGNPIKQANAHLVEWSDGSLQLMVGKELMDVDKREAPKNAQLWGRFDGQPLLECHAMIHSKYTVKPGDLQTSTHRQLSAALEKKLSTNYRGAKQVIIHHNPDAEHEQKEKERDDLLRSREKLEADQDKLRRQYDPMSLEFLEDGNGPSVARDFRHKRSWSDKHGGAHGANGSSSRSSSESDPEPEPETIEQQRDAEMAEPATDPMGTGANQQQDDDDDDDDDDDAGLAQNRVRKRQRIVNDDDDDDE